MNRFFYIISAIVVSALIVTPAFSGSNPKGKPFIAINDQIVEVEGAVSSLQDQIDLLVARVDTVEDRVTACEDAMLTLEDQNSVLEALVQQNLSDIAAIEAEIVLLQQANTDLLELIAANSGDIETLKADVDANEAMITTLQSALGMVQNDLISLETSLQNQIENNEALITALQSEVDQINTDLQLKQDLVNGTCPDGSAIQQILPDGSVICEGVGGTSGQLHSVHSYKYSPLVGPGLWARVSAYCPYGYTATGAGFASAYRWDVHTTYTFPDSSYENGGYVSAQNLNTYDDYILAVTTCTCIVP